MKYSFKEPKLLVINCRWFNLLTIYTSLFTIIFTFSLLHFSVLGYSYTFVGITPPGDPVRNNSARTSAMGNIIASCITNEPNIYYLPASVMYIKNRQLSLTLNFLPVEEKWIIEDQPGLTNFQNYIFTSLTTVLPFDKFSFGIGITPLNDMQYKIKQDIYRASILEETKHIINTGTLYSYTIAAGYKIRSFSFGAGLSLLRTHYQTIQETYNYQTRTHTQKKSQGKLNGLNITLSTIIELSKNFLLSLSYIPETILDKKNNIKLPSQSTVSSTLNLENTMLAFELIFSPNKKPELHLGVEHFTDNSSAPIRYGLGFIPHTNDDRHYSFMISCGSGVKIFKNTTLDLAITYETSNNKISESTYIQQNIYKITCSTKFTF